MSESEVVAMIEPLALVESKPLMSEVIAKFDEVACARVVLPVTLSVPLCTALPVVIVPPTLRAPLTVDEPLTANEVLVAPWSDVPPRIVNELLALSAPFALIAPATLRSDASVVEPVTAKVPVEVAPVVVRPPLNAICVDVALPGNGYANVVAAVR